jgi:hypothetical protein
VFKERQSILDCIEGCLCAWEIGQVLGSLASFNGIKEWYKLLAGLESTCLRWTEAIPRPLDRPRDIAMFACPFHQASASENSRYALTIAFAKWASASLSLKWRHSYCSIARRDQSLKAPCC